MIKKIFLWIICAGACCNALPAQKAPKWADKALKALLTVETYDANGRVRKGNGFFVGEQGQAVSDYALFEGAQTAFVTDADGRRMPVTHILGADDMYDVIRFKVDAPKNTPFLQPADAMPATGTEAFLLAAGQSQDGVPAHGMITDVSNIRESYGYYKIDMPLLPTSISAPLLTPDGKVFALTQADASGKDKTFGVSIHYIIAIRIGATDMLSRKYTSIGIRKTWVNDPKEAQIALLLYASQQDARTYLETLNDYIAHFPTLSDGYIQRATHYALRRNELADTNGQQQLIALAAEDMKKAMKYTDNAAETDYKYAQLIYTVAAEDSVVHSEWNIDAASEYLQKALRRDSNPLYRQLEGDIAMYRGDFEQASRAYAIVNQSEYASPGSFYMAAKARQQLPGYTPFDIVALMDSAVSKCLPSEALPYLEETAELKMEAGLYDAAIQDYNRCYSLTAGNVSDAFYYLREQAKFRAGDSEGALTDIESALKINPDNAVYHAEKASVYLRLQEPDKATACLEKALAIDATFASAHRLLGVCYLRQAKKDDACHAFRKADELGDPIVKRLIRENCE